MESQYPGRDVKGVRNRVCVEKQDLEGTARICDGNRVENLGVPTEGLENSSD